MVLPEHELVHITWVDSNFSPGWANKHRITASIPLVTTVGFVTFTDNKILEITGSIGDEGAKLNALSIPWASVMKCKIINVKN